MSFAYKVRAYDTLGIHIINGATRAKEAGVFLNQRRIHILVCW